MFSVHKMGIPETGADLRVLFQVYMKSRVSNVCNVIFKYYTLAISNACIQFGYNLYVADTNIIPASCVCQKANIYSELICIVLIG